MRKSEARNQCHSGSAIAVAFAVILFGCASRGTASEHTSWPGATYYSVVAHPGDTVAAIGQRYDVSPFVVAKINRLSAAALIPGGRVMLIPAHSRGTREVVLAEALDRSAPNYATAAKAPALTYSLDSLQQLATKRPAVTRYTPLKGESALAQKELSPRFSWPLDGPIISSFGPGLNGTRNDGINIAAEEGAPFRAAAGGTVSFAGPLRGYGNLILITHARGYVTAYAHAENIAVARGEEVSTGQVIGTAGETGGVDRPQLHFEIRRGVKAIDPNLLLTANS